MSTGGQSWLQLIVGGADAAQLEAVRSDRLREARTEQDRAAVEAEALLADQLRAQLSEQRKRAAELTSLYDLALRLSGVHDLNVLLQDSVSYARRLLGVDVAYLAIVESDGSLTIKVTDGAVGHRLRGVVMPARSGLAGRVVELAEPVHTRDYLADRELEHRSSLDHVAVAEGLRSILGAPLRLRGDVVGVLLVSQREVRTFTPHEVSLLSSLAAIAAVALDNARLIERLRDTAGELAHSNEQLREAVDVVNRAAALHETLLEVASRGGGVEDVIRSLSSVFAGDIIYADHDDVVVACARQGQLTAGGVLLPVDGRSPAKFFGSAGAQLRAQQDLSAVTVPIATIQRYVGALQVVPDEAMHEPDIRMLECAAMTIALVASSEQAVMEAERRTAVELLEQLVSRRVEDETAFARRARALGLNVHEPHTVAVTLPLPGNGARSLRHAQDLLRNHGGLAERVFGDVLIVARCDEATLRTTLKSALPLGTTGIAMAGKGPLALADAYDEAKACVAALAALNREGDHATAAELGPYRFLLSRSGRADALSFVRLTIGPMLDHDAERGTELARTANAFLSSGRHHGATAAALQIHPNTLYQRLSRISTQLGDEWREGDRALDVQLALRLQLLIERTPS